MRSQNQRRHKKVLGMGEKKNTGGCPSKEKRGGGKGEEIHKVRKKVTSNKGKGKGTNNQG